MMSNLNKQMINVLADTGTKIIPGRKIGNVDLYTEWMKWLSYIPDFQKTKIETLSKKTYSELSISELTQLNDYLNQKRMLKLFKIYGTKQISKDEYMEVYNFMREKSIDELMLSKLSIKELKYAEEMIQKYISLPKEKLCEKVEEKQKVYSSLSMVDSYILHKISRVNYSRNMLDLENKIKTDIDENGIMNKKSYSYAAYPYGRRR